MNRLKPTSGNKLISQAAMMRVGLGCEASVTACTDRSQEMTKKSGRIVLHTNWRTVHAQMELCVIHAILGAAATRNIWSLERRQTICAICGRGDAVT